MFVWLPQFSMKIVVVRFVDADADADADYRSFRRPGS